MEDKLVIIAPDSFKGTLSASQVCDAIEAGIKSADNKIKTVKIPVADGGEGTVSALCGDNIVRRTSAVLLENVLIHFTGFRRTEPELLRCLRLQGFPLQRESLIR